MNASGIKPRSVDQPGQTGSQRSLVEAVLAEREPLLQAWWAHRLWQGVPLRTTAAQPVEVIDPGWLNRGAGPDFTEARLRIDGREHWGDVEVHIDESDWWSHGHSNDPAYGRVILHLVLRRGGRPAQRPMSGENIPVLEAEPLVGQGLLELLQSGPDAESLLRRYERIPGRCGLKVAQVGPESAHRLLAHAGETRARQKADRVLSSGSDTPDEQILYRLLCRYVGYRENAAAFEALAESLPIALLPPLLALSEPDARREVLSRWYGMAGLLDDAEPASDAFHSDSDYDALRRHWSALGKPRLKVSIKHGGRPLNAPQRRLLGLFHHLYLFGHAGLLKGWLRLLSELNPIRDAPQLRSKALAAIDAAFAGPNDALATEPNSQARGARLIGRDRQIVLMANAILPFFLAIARRDGNLELERLLYRLYIVLPPEASNARIRFMEQRLAVLAPPTRSLRSHQGLLQIHQDFCLSFEEGCTRCRLPDLIS